MSYYEIKQAKTAEINAMAREHYDKMMGTEFPEMLGRTAHGNFGVPRGWQALVYDLCAMLRRVGQSLGARVHVHQVKSKFGGLRFYYDAETDDDIVRDIVSSLVQHVEALSDYTCEVCGAPARKTDAQGWISTLCEKHVGGPSV